MRRIFPADWSRPPLQRSEPWVRFAHIAACLVSACVALALVPVATAQTPEENDAAAEEARKNDTLPLIPTRTLSFTTDEGTWISLDLSPDGRTIVFELLGDLYTLPSEGGEATRITSGQAYDMQPRYSPDGGRIVFVSDRNGSENLWIADADGGNAEALTEDERENYMSPMWTADGRYVIANKGIGQTILTTDISSHDGAGMNTNTVF